MHPAHQGFSTTVHCMNLLSCSLCRCKWLCVVRLFADVLNDVAIFLEIVAPVFQQYFRLIVCTAGVSKVSSAFFTCHDLELQQAEQLLWYDIFWSAVVPSTTNPGSRTRPQPAIDHCNAVSTFHDNNICETRFSMLCTSCLELTTTNCSQ